MTLVEWWLIYHWAFNQIRLHDLMRVMKYILACITECFSTCAIAIVVTCATSRQHRRGDFLTKLATSLRCRSSDFDGTLCRNRDVAATSPGDLVAMSRWYIAATSPLQQFGSRGGSQRHRCDFCWSRCDIAATQLRSKFLTGLLRGPCLSNGLS